MSMDDWCSSKADCLPGAAEFQFAAGGCCRWCKMDAGNKDGSRSRSRNLENETQGVLRGWVLFIPQPCPLQPTFLPLCSPLPNSAWLDKALLCFSECSSPGQLCAPASAGSQGFWLGMAGDVGPLRSAGFSFLTKNGDNGSGGGAAVFIWRLI